MSHGTVVRVSRHVCVLQFKEVQDEMQHKFSLQVAENKRLQSHVSRCMGQ
jgi:hypothetical protein